MLFDAPFPLILSPMDDVTDLPFRQLCKRFGADGLITEFIASEALNREAEKSRRKMLFTPEQHPVGIQIFGADEDSLLRCIDIVAAEQSDFIDINWGCPVRKVAGKGAGSGMLNDIPKLVRITAALVKRSPLPVTVKTRLGYDETNKPIVSLAEQLQDVGVAAISIHGRTKSQMYKGNADWSLIAATKANPRLHIPVFGNGDLTTPYQVVEARDRYGVDGVSVAERVEVCKSHLLSAIEFKGEHTAIFEMRKHYGGYFYGLPHFKQFRIPLVTFTRYEELATLFEKIKEFYT